MSKNKIIIDEKLKHRIDKIIPGEVGGGLVTCGVLLELKTGETDRFIVETAPTPFTKAWTTDDAPDEAWIAEHAAQVSNMTIGGLAVAGFYVTASETYMNKYVGSFEYILKLLVKSQGILEPFLLTWPTHDRRAVLRKFVSVKRTTLEGEKINFKYQKVSAIIYESLWTVGKRPVSIQRFSADDIKELCEEIVDDERNRLDEAYLHKQDTPDAKSSAPSKEPVTVELLADVFFNMSEVLPDGNVPYLDAGSVHTRCIVPSNSKDEQIQQTLRDDVLRSIRARIDQISEQIQSALNKPPGSPVPKPKSFHLPRRVFFKCSNFDSAARFCDYALPDEPEADVRARCKDLLGFSNDALTSLEILSFEAPHGVLPPDEDAVKPPTTTPLLEIAGTKPGQKELLGPYAGYWLLGAIFVGGIFVITLVYLLKK